MTVQLQEVSTHGRHKDTPSPSSYTFWSMEQSQLHFSRTCVSAAANLMLAPTLADLCSSPCSTIRQPCRLKKTWKRWCKYLYCDRGQWQLSTPNCLACPCVSYERKAWCRMVYHWLCRGWWSISVSMVRKKRKQPVTICETKWEGFYIVAVIFYQIILHPEMVLL